MPFHMSRTSLVKTFALTALIAPLMAGTALAWTGDEVGKRLQNLLKEQMVEFTYSKAEVDGQTVILRDAKATVPALEEDKTNDKDSASLNLGDVTLERITETADGTYIVDKASLSDTKIIEDSTVISIAGIRIEKLKLTENPKIDILGRMEYLEGFYIDELSLSQGGIPFLSLSGTYLTNEPYTKEKASNFSWGFKALDIDLEEIDRIDKAKKQKEAAELKKAAAEAVDIAAAEAEAAAAVNAPDDNSAVKEATKAAPDETDIVDDVAEATIPDAARTDDVATTEDDNEATDDTDVAVETADTSSDLDIESIRALGLQKLHASMAVKGSWSPYSGQYNIDQMTLNSQNVGDFSYRLHMGGYDMKFVKGMQDFYSNILKDGPDNTSMQIAAMGLLQNLSISNMEMRYDDASFFNKLLEHEAKKKSLSRDELVQEMKDQLKIGLDYFEGEPRVADAVKAVGEFLDQPKSISLKIQPEQPVSFGILTAVGMAEPKKLWSVLGVTVEANN